MTFVHRVKKRKPTDTVDQGPSKVCVLSGDSSLTNVITSPTPNVEPRMCKKTAQKTYLLTRSNLEKLECENVVDPRFKHRGAVEQYNAQMVKEAAFLKYASSDINDYLKEDLEDALQDERKKRGREREIPEEEKPKLICKSTALKTWLLSTKDLEKLECQEAPNPHYKCAAPMLLYEEPQVKKLSFLKHASDDINDYLSEIWRKHWMKYERKER